MQITGSNIIAAPGGAVWDALNDPDVLRRCLPGCESVERTSPEDFRIVMTASVGPLKAKFNGKLRMTDAVPPTSCVLHFEGQGGPMGFGKGTSTVTLRPVPEGTELTYTAEAQVGGKLAQVGSRLIDGVARKMSDDFFKAFRNQVAPPAADEGKPAPKSAEPVEREARSAPAAVAVAATTLPTPVTAPRESTSFVVPAWWLAPAFSLGAIAAIAGGLLLR